MRIYGIKSGKNNMSRLLARSIMYNMPKTQTKTVKEKSELGKKFEDAPDDRSVLPSIMLILFTIVVIILNY